ncbi:MAG: ABC transporter permease [Microbacteriaceae bacterium]
MTEKVGVRAARVGAPRGGVTGVRTAPSIVAATVLGVAIPLTFLGIFFVLPVAGMIGRGFFTDGFLDLMAFTEVLSRPRTLRLVGLTFAGAGISTVVCTVLGVPIAHVLYRLNFRGRAVVRALVIVPFVLPTVVVGVAFRTLFRDGGQLGGLGLDGTFAAILLALIFFNIAVVVRTVGALWEGLDSRQEDAASVLGASPLRVLTTITLPRLAPAITSAAAIVFLFCSTAFGIILVLGGVRFGTIETEIYFLTTQFLDLRAAAVLSIVQLAIVSVVLAIAARTRNARSGSRARGRAWRAGATTAVPQRRLSASQARRNPRVRDLPAIVVTVVTAAALALPVAALIERSLRTPSGWGLDNFALLSTTGTRNALVVPVWEALGNSLSLASWAALIAVVMGVFASFVLSRQPRSAAARRALALFDTILMLPLGVSAVTVGFGFLITLNQPPLDLRASPVLVPIAQALIAFPLVVRTILPVLSGIDSRMRESAAALGASPLRVLADVDLAIVARPVLAASGFAFVVALGEFGATSFLSRPDHPTLPVVIFRLLGQPGGDNFEMAVAASVVLAAVSVAIIALVERLRVGTLGAF